MVLGRARHGGRRRDLERELRDLRFERGIFGHQAIRLDDLGLVEQAGVAQPRRGPAELLGHVGQRLERTVALLDTAGARPVRLGIPQHECLGHRDAAGGREPTEHAFHHCPSERARSSAARISAVEVAPGS